MKTKLIFIKTVVLGFCFIPLIFGALLTIQLLTNQTPPFYDWQMSLLIIAVYLILSVCLAIGIFLIQAMNKLSSKESFTVANLVIVNRIRVCLLLISIFILGILPKFYKLADLSDAPGVMLVGLAIVFIPFSVYLLTSSLIHLLEQAIHLKNDDDLTV